MNHRIPPPKPASDTSVAIIPAAPGTRLLVPDDDLRHCWPTAVIAWRIVTSQRGDLRTGQPGAVVLVEPITSAADDMELSPLYALQHPGSQHVEVPGSAAFESAAAWLADLRKEGQP